MARSHTSGRTTFQGAGYVDSGCLDEMFVIETVATGCPSMLLMRQFSEA